MFLRRFSHTIAPISPDLFLFINNNFFKRRPIQKMEMRKNWNLKKNLIYFSTKLFVPLFLMVMLGSNFGKNGQYDTWFLLLHKKSLQRHHATSKTLLARLRTQSPTVQTKLRRQRQFRQPHAHQSVKSRGALAWNRGVANSLNSIPLVAPGLALR